MFVLGDIPGFVPDVQKLSQGMFQSPVSSLDLVMKFMLTFLCGILIYFQKTAL